MNRKASYPIRRHDSDRSRKLNKTLRGNLQQRLLVPVVIVIVVTIMFSLPSSSRSKRSTNIPSHRGFVSAASLATTTTTTSQGTTSPFGTSTTSSGKTILSKDYDVYIIVTPFENTIGRAVAEELAKQLLAVPSPSSRKEHATRINPVMTTSVICLVRCPPYPSNRRRSSSDENKTVESSFDNNNKNVSNNGAFFLQLLQWLRKLGNACFRYMNIESKENYEEKENNLWMDQFSTASSPILVLSSGKETTRANDFSFDPFGGTSNIRDSSEQCLKQIRMQLFQRMAEEAMSSSKNCTASAISSSNYTNANTDTDISHDDAVSLLSTTIRIRGILFNPYGCPPPPPAVERIRSCNDDNSKTIITPPRQQILHFSPLAEYKLISIAIFVDVALSTRTTKLKLPMSEFLRDRESESSSLIGRESKGDSSNHEGEMGDEPNHQYKPKQWTSVEEPTSSSSPLRIIVVGTEAARGLPKMGIPVPDLDGATESSIRDKLLLFSPKQRNNNAPSDHEGGSHWESEYAEMNALGVMYFKALESSMSTTTPNPDTAVGGSTTGSSYFGVVSPGMTPESFKIVHVPEAARTMAFRWKLWLCNRRWIFGWLQRCEIAKTTEQAGDLLVKALLNGSMEDTSTNHREEAGCENEDPKSGSSDADQHRLRRWDDIYPSGSFVGARSGTGGPLCEQSLLVYDATSDLVGPGPMVEDALSGGLCAVAAAANGDCDGVKKDKGSSSDKEPPNGTFNRNHERVNFLGKHRLQARVHRVVREIIVDSTS
jgi:hypothetical protein